MTVPVVRRGQTWERVQRYGYVQFEVLAVRGGYATCQGIRRSRVRVDRFRLFRLIQDAPPAG